MIINWKKEIKNLEKYIKTHPEDGLDISFDYLGDDEEYKMPKNNGTCIWIGEIGSEKLHPNKTVMIITKAGIRVPCENSFIKWEDLESLTSNEDNDITVKHSDGEFILYKGHIHAEIVEFINKIASYRETKKVLVNKINYSLKSNRADNLLKNLDKLIKLEPHPDHYFTRGWCLFEKEKYKEACYDFEKVNDLVFSGKGDKDYEWHQKIAETNYMLALAYKKTGNLLFARAAIQKASNHYSDRKLKGKVEPDISEYFEYHDELIRQLTGNPKSSRTAIQRPSNHCSDRELKGKIEEELSDISNDFSNKFLDRPYSKRRNIMIVNKLPDIPSKNVYFLTNDNCHGEGWKWEP